MRVFSTLEEARAITANRVSPHRTDQLISLSDLESISAVGDIVSYYRPMLSGCNRDRKICESLDCKKKSHKSYAISLPR